MTDAQYVVAVTVLAASIALACCALLALALVDASRQRRTRKDAGA